MPVFTNSIPGFGSWVIPAGITTINVAAFGSGAGGANNSPGGYAVGGGGGGCGITTSLTVIPGGTVYYYIGQGGIQGANGTNSWVNIKANVVPSSTSNGALGAGGTADPTSYTAASGGLAANCIGTATYSGGYGINTSSTQYGVSGGGGGAGLGGAGANSSNLVTTGTITGGLGGIAGGNFTAGGQGGNGYISDSIVGQSGTIPGGGGGGSSNTGSIGNGTGGAGGNGQIQIQYGISNNVNISEVSGITSVGVLTPTFPINNPPASKATVTTTATVLTTKTFIPGYPSQALATTEIGSVSIAFPIQKS